MDTFRDLDDGRDILDMAINENWNIRSRASVCAQTGKPFVDGESFMTVLQEDPQTGALTRRDFSMEGWAEVEPDLGSCFSFWKSEYEVVKTEARPEIAEKESAVALLRRLCEEDSITTANTRYILAVMLERKKQLKQTGTQETEDATILVYEHPASGEIYLIRDPELKLAQIEEVQREVSRLLGGGGESAPAEEGKPGSKPEEDSVAVESSNDLPRESAEEVTGKIEEAEAS